MSEEEERRRCIILGICGPGTGAVGAKQEARRSALRESLGAQGEEGMSDDGLDYILALIDEARKAKRKPKKKAKA